MCGNYTWGVFFNDRPSTAPYKNHPGKLQTIRKKERKNIKSQEEIEQKKSINLFGEITCFISWNGVLHTKFNKGTQVMELIIGESGLVC